MLYVTKKVTVQVYCNSKMAVEVYMKYNIEVMVTVSTEFNHYVFARNWNTYLSAVNPMTPHPTAYTWSATRSAEFAVLQVNVYKMYEKVYRKLGIRPGNGECCKCTDLARIISWGDALVNSI